MQPSRFCGWCSGFEQGYNTTIDVWSGMEYATRRARATWADVMLSSPCRAQSYPGTVSHPIFSCFVYPQSRELFSTSSESKTDFSLWSNTCKRCTVCTFPILGCQFYCIPANVCPRGTHFAVLQWYFTRKSGPFFTSQWLMSSQIDSQFPLSSGQMGALWIANVSVDRNLVHGGDAPVYARFHRI